MTLSWLYNNQYIQQLHEEIKTNKLLFILLGKKLFVMTLVA